MSPLCQRKCCKNQSEKNGSRRKLINGININIYFKFLSQIKSKLLIQYFRKDEIFYAHDPEKKCKVGDIVLIQELPNKLTRLITHKVMDIIYPLGDITDPVTGEYLLSNLLSK